MPRYIFDGSCLYKREKSLGKGRFGKVIRCKTKPSKGKVALKIVEEQYHFSAKNELSVLEKLETLDRENINVIIFSHHFNHKQSICLAFELLDRDLLCFMRSRLNIPLNLSQIRVIAQQMLVALEALKRLHVVHADIKPNNIMMVNHKLYPFKVKLIDFGVACPVSEIHHTHLLQKIGFRAPECYLGLPKNESIDMWALACVLAFLYLGKYLHPVAYEYEAMKVITQMHGQLDDHQLNKGAYTKQYFTKDEDSPTAPWRLYTRLEYSKQIGTKTKEYLGISAKFASIDDISKSRRGKVNTKSKDNLGFLSLLKDMLQVDASKRITPSEALQHRFITMEHLPSGSEDRYVESALSAIKKCMLWQQPANKPSLKSKVENLNEEDITCSDMYPVDEETTVEINNGPSATDGLDETIPAVADGTPPATTDLTSSSTGPHGALATARLDGIIGDAAVKSQDVNINKAEGTRKVQKWRKLFSDLKKMVQPQV